MNYSRIAVAAGITAALISCSPSVNPQLDMCLKITGNLMQSELAFGESSESESNGQMQLTLPFTVNNEPGEAICIFAKEPGADRSHDGGKYSPSPRTVVLNGREVGNKELIKAALASSAGVLKDSALEAKNQAAEAVGDARVAAKEAKEKASELAGEAKVKATELAGEARTKTGEFADKVKDSGIIDRAKTLANEAAEKARSAALEGTRKIQEKLESPEE